MLGYLYGHAKGSALNGIIKIATPVGTLMSHRNCDLDAVEGWTFGVTV